MESTGKSALLLCICFEHVFLDLKKHTQHFRTTLLKRVFCAAQGPLKINVGVGSYQNITFNTSDGAGAYRVSCSYPNPSEDSASKLAILIGNVILIHILCLSPFQMYYSRLSWKADLEYLSPKRCSVYWFSLPKARKLSSTVMWVVPLLQHLAISGEQSVFSMNETTNAGLSGISFKPTYAGQTTQFVAGMPLSCFVNK